MKKILLIATLLIFCQGIVSAQKPQQVTEKEVNTKFVKDFHKQAPNAKDTQWERINNDTFRVRFTNEDKERQALLYSNKGTETLFYVDEQYYPSAIKDTLKARYPKHSITELAVRKVKTNMSYQANIAITKKSGILWWRKTEIIDPKTVNFDINGKFIDAVDD